MGMLLILIENGRSSKHLEFPPPEVKRGKDHPLSYKSSTIILQNHPTGTNQQEEIL